MSEMQATRTTHTIEATQARAEAAQATLEQARADLAAAQQAAQQAQRSLEALDIAASGARAFAARRQRAAADAAQALTSAQADLTITQRSGSQRDVELASERLTTARERAEQAAQGAQDAEKALAELERHQHQNQRPEAQAALQAAQALVKERAGLVAALEAHSETATLAHGQATLAQIAEEYRAVGALLVDGYSAITAARAALATLEESAPERLATFPKAIGDQAPTSASLHSYDALCSIDNLLAASSSAAGKHANTVALDGRPALPLANVLPRWDAIAGMLDGAQHAGPNRLAAQAATGRIEMERRRLAPIISAVERALELPQPASFSDATDATDATDGPDNGPEAA